MKRIITLKPFLPVSDGLKLPRKNRTICGKLGSLAEPACSFCPWLKKAFFPRQTLHYQCEFACACACVVRDHVNVNVDMYTSVAVSQATQAARRHPCHEKQEGHQETHSLQHAPCNWFCVVSLQHASCN